MKDSTHGPGVVFFSAQDYWYHNRAHSDVQLARALSADRRVLLVNSLGMRMPTSTNTTQPLRRVERKVRSTLRAVRRPESDAHPRLYVMTPVSVPAFHVPWLRRMNAWLVRLQVSVVARLLGIGPEPDMIITLPTAWDVVRRMRVRSLVVNRSDRYSALPEADNYLIASMEAEMLGACHAAVFVSRELMAEEAPLVTRGEAVYLGHGVDLDHFDSALIHVPPADIAEIAGPRIGFFGGIDDYVVDLPLVRRMAVEMPDVSVVLIGAATCDIEDLVALENVHWLGMKPYEQIPAYGAAFDVAIMPWLQSDWIRFCNPVKTKEYLALGLPVVTTRYPEADAHVVAVADTPEDFLKLVRQAVDGDPVADPETRRAHVKGDSWSARADVLRALFHAGSR